MPEGQLTIALSTMASFELIQIAGSPERQYLDSLYDYVIGATDKGELDTVSGLANSFTISADGTSFTIKTRTGVTFHNGDAASAKDVLDRLNRCKAAGSRCSTAGDLNTELASLESPDDTTLLVKLKTINIWWHLRTLSLLGSGGSANHVQPAFFH